MPYLGASPDTAIDQKDLNGQKLIIDADADTSIHASTDDQIDVEVADFGLDVGTPGKDPYAVHPMVTGRCVQRRHHDDGNHRRDGVALQGLADLEAIDLRQPQVQQDQVGLLSKGFGESLLAIGGFYGGKSVLFEKLAQS